MIFYSKKLSPAETNYEIHDKKLLIIVKYFKEWKIYLKKFKYQIQIFTDHKNLLYFTTIKVLNQRQIRWSKKLSKYNFKIIYRAENKNFKADAFNKKSDYFEKIEEPNEAILKKSINQSLNYNTKYIITISSVQHDNALLKEIKKKQINDRNCQKWVKKQPEEVTIRDKILHFQGLIYVPISLRSKMIREHHNPRIYEHSEVGKIMEHIQRNYYFPEMRKAVEKHTATCVKCNQNKASRHKLYEHIKTSTISDREWKFIAMNFITKLSKSKKFMTKVLYDSILIITNRLTKYCYFLSYRKKSTTENLA